MSKMLMDRILNFNDFVNTLHKSGFSMGGGNDEGIYAIIPWSWNEAPPYETSVRWHTEDLETDPWEWRMRVLNERDDIAYAKLFFNKSGYITKEWYPYFLAVRRDGADFNEAYFGGAISHIAKRIYGLISRNDMMPLHIIKQEGGFGKEDKSKFDRAITELQMKMYITMCGSAQKLSAKGEEYGWNSTMFCTVERFWGESVFDKAAKITIDEAIEKITEQVYELNPNADGKKIKKFIL
jgi:hypothetical protein